MKKIMSLFSGKLLGFVAVILLLLAMVNNSFGEKQSTLKLLQSVFTEAITYETTTGKFPVYHVFDEFQQLLGYGVMTSAAGYGGPLTVLTGIDEKGDVVEVKIIEHYETPLYLREISKHNFTDRFKYISYSKRSSLIENIDFISGATVSSEAITLAVDKALYQISVQLFGFPEIQKKQIPLRLEDLILVLIYIVIIISVWKKFLKIRPYVLGFSVIYLGFWISSPINIGNLSTLIIGNLPSWWERPFWFLLIIGTLIITLFLGRNVYCYWLCPFGAVQEGIHKGLSLVKYNIPRGFLLHARKIRLTLTWIALMAAFLFSNPTIASYEPFSVFFQGQGSKSQWTIMGLVLFLSLFINRSWCRFFCPTGAVLDIIAHTKGKVKKRCVVGRTSEQVVMPMEGRKDIKFAFLLVLFIVLILMTLFFNMEIIGGLK